MGSKNGKYDIEHGISSHSYNERLPSLSSNLNKTMHPTQSKKEIASIPKCIHQDILKDRSVSNSEILSLVWLDLELRQRPVNLDIEVKLKNLNSYVRLFDRVDTCERYIKQIGKMNNYNHMKQEKLLVIISTTLAPTIIPHLHNLSQVKYIYIFGKPKSISKAHEEWLRTFNKV